MTPAPPIPAPSGARNHQKQEVIDPNKKRTLGQFCWPPLGKSHGRQRAVLTAAAGQILMTIDTPPAEPCWFGGIVFAIVLLWRMVRQRQVPDPTLHESSPDYSGR